MSPDPRPDTVVRPRHRVRRWSERLWYALLIAFCLVVVWVGVTAAAGVSPGFCGLCHVGDTEALDRSAHADIHCDYCHSAPGAAGVVESRTGLVQMTVDRLVPGGDVTPAYVDNSRCLACHEQQIAVVTESNGIRMSHTALIVDNWSCTRCHPTTAHGTESLRQVGYNMDMCLQCHSTNPENQATCRTCHPDGAPATLAAGGGAGAGSTEASSASPYSTPWRATHGSQIKQTHGMGDLTTCSACHSPEQCLACHTTPMPHPANYLQRHGGDALAQAEADCLDCHRESMCGDCHQIDMPHPDDYLRGHSADVKQQGQDSCVRCHPEESCLDCHLLHTHPGVPADTVKKLRERPVS